MCWSRRSYDPRASTPAITRKHTRSLILLRRGLPWPIRLISAPTKLPHQNAENRARRPRRKMKHVLTSSRRLRCFSARLGRHFSQRYGRRNRERPQHKPIRKSTTPAATTNTYRKHSRVWRPLATMPLPRGLTICAPAVGGLSRRLLSLGLRVYGLGFRA